MNNPKVMQMRKSHACAMLQLSRGFSPNCTKPFQEINGKIFVLIQTNILPYVDASGCKATTLQE